MSLLREHFLAATVLHLLSLYLMVLFCGFETNISFHRPHTHTETHTDSPGVPASASAYELFRGFSFVAPILLDDDADMNGKAISSSNGSMSSALLTSSSAGCMTAATSSSGVASGIDLPDPQANSKPQAGTSSTTAAAAGATAVPSSAGALKSPLISRCKGRMLSEYQFFEVIGEGSFSVCKRCVHSTTQQEYAVKVRREYVSHISTCIHYSFFLTVR